MDGLFELPHLVETLGVQGDAPFDVLEPAGEGARLPVVLASPHSGRHYSPAFLAASRLDAVTLRRSEDSFVDEVFGAGPSLGAPLLRARFPRAFLDANREMYELDPAMFEDELPAFVNRSSPRVQVGLGTIARIVGSGEAIYAKKLRFSEAEARIDALYRPYHEALRRLVDEARAAFGYYILVDCHSMPSTAAPPVAGVRPDIVLGDCHGRACHPEIIAAAEACLSKRGYRVVRNAPYAGGFTTGHYGAPREGGHGLQVEVCRSLYMDERSLAKKPALRRIAADMAALVEALAAVSPALLRPRPRAPARRVSKT